MAGSNKMRVCMCTGLGGYHKMQILEEDKPKCPGAGQVLLKVIASGINFTEVFFAIQGRYHCKEGLITPPRVLGIEASGTVEEVGPGVENIKVGDRVFATNPTFGLWKEFVLIDAEWCFVLPEKMTFEEAACIPVNYLTAYIMLFDQANLRKGKSVLVHMAAGGVGFAATQLIKSVEGTTVFGTASAHKHEAIQMNGVDHPIDYRNKDYVEEIRKISPKGVDIVLDPLSGADTRKGYDLLTPLGKLISYGAANLLGGEHTSQASFTPLYMLVDNKSIAGFHLSFLDVNMVKAAANDLLRLYREGHVKPQVDSVWPFENAGDAMKYIADRRNIGKVILSWKKTEVDVEQVDVSLNKK